MKRQRLLQLIVTFICAVFFACAGFAVSNYFEREDTVTARAAVAPIYWGVNGDTLTFDTTAVSGNPSGCATDGNISNYRGDYHTKVRNVSTVRESIKKVNFLNEISTVDASSLFSKFTNLITVENADKLDLSHCTDLTEMFYNCSSLTTIDVSKWNVSQCTVFCRMFSGCNKLQELDVSNWDMQSAERILQMFQYCKELTVIDVSNWKMPNLNHLNGVFEGCEKVEKIDVSKWDTSKVVYFMNLFNGCKSLKYVDISGFEFSIFPSNYGSTDMDMFKDVPALEVLKLSPSAISYFKNPPDNPDYPCEPKLPPLRDKNGNPYPTLTDSDGYVYTDVSSLPDNGGVFLTNVAHTHDYDTSKDKVTSPTCTAGGYTDSTCYMCDEVTRVNPTNALGHALTPVDAKDKTCTTDGNIAYFSCSRCSKKFSDLAGTTELSDSDIKIAASHGLSHVDGVAAKCTDTGVWEHYHCADCGKNFGDAAGMNELSTIVIPAKGHKYTNYAPNGDATCTTDGTKTANCDNGCGNTDTITDTGSMLGHDFSIVVSGTPPTCQHGGSAIMQCSRCTETETQSSGSPVPHSYTNYVSNGDATCTADGTKTAQCDFGCGTEDTQPDAGSALGHSFTNYVPNGDATLTADGTKTAYCDHGCGATDTQPDTGSMLTAVQITVTINPVSSELGAALETLTATITSGTLIDPADMPYTLSTDADINTMGTYTITGVCTDSRYDITFVESVYIVSKKADDPNGGGEIDLPVDINVEFKVTQSSTDNDYSELEGLKRGYWAQLWYRNEDGTLGDEFTDKMNCFLTLKIPTEIIEAIRGGEEINRDKIAEGLTVYYYVDGQRYDVDNFAIAQRDDESWQIKFNYNAKFRAEVVFNAANFSEKSEPAAGIPWWVWLIVGLAGAAVVGVVIVIIVVAKKKNSAAVAGGAAYDDAELRAQLTEQDKKLDEIREIVDGGFNDVVDDE